MLDIRGLVKSGVNVISNINSAFFSHAQLSDKRKEDISIRRDELKVMDDDSPIVRIVIDEMLSYKPRLLTLDDRYLQLEKILDAIDKARANKNPECLFLVCSEVYKELLEKPGHLKNALLECLGRINLKMENTEGVYRKAKL